MGKHLTPREKINILLKDAERRETIVFMENLLSDPENLNRDEIIKLLRLNLL